jgi:hypothetical protein
LLVDIGAEERVGVLRALLTQVSSASSINGRLAERLTKEPTRLLVRVPLASYGRAPGELKCRVGTAEELGVESCIGLLQAVSMYYVVEWDAQWYAQRGKCEIEVRN